MLYLLVNASRALWLVKKRAVLLWIAFVFLWPLLTVPYAPVFDIKAIGLNLYMVLLMIATAVWVSRCGVERAGRLLVAAALVTVFGLVLSMFASDYFAAVAEAANAHATYKNRAFGFFLQPNMAAENASFMFAVLVTPLALRSVSEVAVATLIFVVAIMVTGSRGGMIIAFAVLAYAFVFSASPTTVLKKSVVTKQIAGVVAVVLAVFFVSQIIDLVSSSGGRVAGEGFTLADRVRAVLTLDIKAGGLVETAVSRYIALQEHFAGILSSPIVGQGMAASQNLAARGSLTYASHNQYLQVAYDLGIPAMIVYLYLIIELWKNADSPVARHLTGGVQSARLLVISMALAGLFSNSILNSRVFFIALGVVIAMRYAPVQVFRRNVSLSTIDSVRLLPSVQ